MKYIVGEVNKANNDFHFEPIYVPACSLCEPLYLRIITGNFRPSEVMVSIVGNAASSNIKMEEIYPTVFEIKLDKKYFKDILSTTVSKFKINLSMVIDNDIKTVESEEIIKILGVSFGRDSLTDISEIYSRLNAISDRL